MRYEHLQRLWAAWATKHRLHTWDDANASHLHAFHLARETYFRALHELTDTYHDFWTCPASWLSTRDDVFGVAHVHGISPVDYQWHTSYEGPLGAAEEPFGRSPPPENPPSTRNHVVWLVQPSDSLAHFQASLETRKSCPIIVGVRDSDGHWKTALHALTQQNRAFVMCTHPTRVLQWNRWREDTRVERGRNRRRKCWSLCTITWFDLCPSQGCAAGRGPSLLPHALLLRRHAPTDASCARELACALSADARA